MSPLDRATLVAAFSPAVESRLSEAPSIYTYLSGSHHRGKGVQVINHAQPGGGSEQCFWLGEVEFKRRAKDDAYRAHMAAELSYNAYGADAK